MQLVVRNLPVNAGDVRPMGSIPELGRSPGEGHGQPILAFLPGESHDREAWQAMVHRVAQSWR